MMFVFVTGGVVSSLGKGITAAAVGRLIRARGIPVTAVKLDPYLNVDAGTLSPLQHGEVFVTVDGGETDLDLGHYERFLDRDLTRDHCVTAGQVYQHLLARERRGDFLGGTVQVVPHVTDEICRRLRQVAERLGAGVVLVEVGGTVGDIEGMPFLEAIRQLGREAGPGRTAHVHLTLVPYLAAAGELKTKPTQHSVRDLRAIGLQPDFIVCRSVLPLPEEARRKIALFCNVDPEAVFSNPDLESIYQVPLHLEAEGVGRGLASLLGLGGTGPDLTAWEGMVGRLFNPRRRLRIALVGKYVTLPDAYLSVTEALTHAGAARHTAIDIEWLSAEEVGEDDPRLAGVAAIVVPGGFGQRGIEGKIRAIKYARENGVPFLGLCLGLQCAVVEVARNVGGLDAHSTEFARRTPNPVVALLPGQRGVRAKGGTMRLGAYPCHITADSRVGRVYGVEAASERHRHRWEVNPAYVARLQRWGLRPVGIWPEGDLVEIMELEGHPWFVGTQFHPEFLSRPERPHPLFAGLIAAAETYAENTGS
ncbi:MAG TPA: CTP synthase [Bacillota bacterium]|nr:CTP synthase [Bacillota bacterium]